MNYNPIGQRLNSILIKIENILIDHEVYHSTKPEYSIDAFRAILKLFMSALLDKMYELQEKENMPLNDRKNMAVKAGEDIRKIIKIYTDIETLNLYDKK